MATRRAAARPRGVLSLAGDARSLQTSINGACGGGTAHRFAVSLPGDSCSADVHVYGINEPATPGSTIELTGSPKSLPACDVPEPPSCGPGNAWIEEGTHAVGSPCGDTCGGYHYSWCDYDGDGSTSDGWQFCLSSGWAQCGYHPH